MQALVSILIPAFNSERWVAQTIRSAANQTWQRKEIIVVDDGSTDRTFEIARRFESRLIKVVSQPNAGASAARNAALKLCQGDYVQWLDADDLLDPEKISLQMRAVEEMRNDRTLFSCPWAFFRHRHYKARFVPTTLWCDLSPADWLFRKIEQNLFMSSATWLVSRGLTDNAGPWDETLLKDNDGEYFCRVLLGSDSVHFVPSARAYYRRPEAHSVSYIGRSRQKLESQLRSLRLHIQYLQSLEESERVRTACLQFLQRWLICFYPGHQDLVQEMQYLATENGGYLEAPRLPWKYAWLKPIFGWNFASDVQLRVQLCKETLLRYWDKAMFHLDSYSLGMER